MTAQPYQEDKYAAAIAMLEKRITETAIAAAPTLGLLPAAVITGVHCYVYLNFGPVFSPLVGAGVEAVSIAIVATRLLLASNGLAHREKDMDNAFRGYLFSLATVNLGLNVFHGFSVGWTFDLAGITLAELALGLLSVPVAWLVATRHEITMVGVREETAKADAAALRAEAEANAAKIRAEERQFALDLIAAKGAEKRANQLAQVEKQLVQAATSPVQVATSPVQGHIDLVVLAEMLKQVPQPTNKELGKLFHVTGEAVRLARKNKLNGI